MATLNQGSVNRFMLQPGESLSIVSDANSTCRYGQPATKAQQSRAAIISSG